MKDLRNRIAHMLWLFAALFAVMGGYLVHVAAFEAEEFIANPFNARVRLYDTGVRRGGIYDADGVVIVESIARDGAYTRQYPFGPVFAHTAGYSDLGRAGLELSRNFTMYRLQWELFQRARHAIFGDELVANSIITTFDAPLQEMIFNALGNSSGAVVVLDPRTGAVLAMVSTPSFDPNRITQEWPGLIANTDASPLLNRASQGLYPPGSTFKVITAAAALQHDPDLLYHVFECTGHAVFGENVLQCWGGIAHGTVDMSSAMALSCNGFFAALAEKIGPRPIIYAAQAAGFNSPIAFELPAQTPLFPMDTTATVSELIETSIGQGRTTATPLNMALIAAAIANGGVAMSPYMVDSVVGANGGTISTTSPRMAGRLFEPQTAELLSQMLAQAVTHGTAAPAALPNMQVAGKTGTAQNETGIDHSWFIGHAPADNPTMALAIIIENTGGGTRASQLAGQIFQKLEARVWSSINKWKYF